MSIMRPIVKPMPLLMWFVTLVFVFYQFILQLSSGIMISPLIGSFHTTALGASIVSSSYYYVYVALQTPAGLSSPPDRCSHQAPFHPS